jgi:predicted ATPase
VRTIVGTGGVGKTRLALKVASEWESRGDEWRRVDAGQEAQAVAAARGITSGPVLLVVDYAETRTDLEAMLRALLADRGPIRVLLVARSLGECWERLIEKSAPAIGQLLTEAEPIRLAEQITKKTSEADLIADAIPQFARALKCAVPEQIEFELPAQPVPVLVLHTAALVAALRFRDDPAASLRVVVAKGAG